MHTNKLIVSDLITFRFILYNIVVSKVGAQAPLTVGSVFNSFVEFIRPVDYILRLQIEIRACFVIKVTIHTWSVQWKSLNFVSKLFSTMEMLQLGIKLFLRL